MKRPDMSRLWCDTGEAHPVPDADYTAGFVKEKPDEYYLNQIQKDEEAFYVANMETGLPTDNPADAVTYAQDSIYFKDGKVFVRKAGGDVESYFGRPYRTVEAELQAFYAVMRVHLIDFEDPHEVTPAQAGTYSKAEFDALNKNQTDDLDAHVKNVNNPHNLTYTQLNCLGAATGGQFTGLVEFANSFLVGGSRVGLESAELLFGSSNKKIGLDNKEPVAYTTSGRQILLHEGNYLTERNKLEPSYVVPVPVLKAALKSSINFQYGHATLDSDWDSLVFTPDGLTLAGAVTASDATKFICPEQTVTCTLKGVVNVQVGAVILKSNGTSIQVFDGDTLVWEGAVNGSITYSRNDTQGLVAVNGVKVIEHIHPSIELPLTVVFSGTGSIKELTIWADALSKEQMAKVG